ncbi:MAG TPA: YbdD/YjiX family protein [Gemmatimonadales bacterium]|jgi:uncharacterized short protein YbdD (DUF466 family)|nr:YbdD/YjiX family protein [Gemmatimonadales bacterium]
MTLPLRLKAVVRVCRQIAGMPDYQAYVAHLAAAHPERPLPTEREFYEEFVRSKYAGGASRCC